MNNEKRSLLAISLSALIFVVYYAFFFKPSINPPSTATPQVEKKLVNESKQTAVTEQTKKTEALPTETVIPLKKTLIDNSLYQVEHSNQGGAIQKFLVKGYQEKVEQNSPLVNLFKETTPQNFLITFHNSNFTLPEILSYRVIQENSNRVEYQWQNDQLTITEQIEWNPNDYLANIKVILENRSTSSLETSPGMRLETAQHPKKEHNWWSFIQGPEDLKYPVLYQENKITRHQDVAKLLPKSEQKGGVQWIGLEDRYFLWSIISRALSAEQTVQYGFKEGNILFLELIYPKEIIAPNGKIEKEFTVYVGPKKIEQLKAANAHLEEAVDYGWFSLVAHPILFLLKFFHRWVGNWGVAIILLTIFIKLILHPINKKTMDSMKSMQKLQPRLAELREKFKNDRERLNVEMMALFKTHKVNPMGGCLPMLLQMPVYIALYKVLYNAIELYHAPFFAFYKDLSAPDPYFILPILLGIFMVIQQKMTPSAAQDPAQAKAMLMMPIVFSVFMLFLPVGLVIYIFVNTSTTVIQQYLHQHDLGFTDLIRRKKKSA